MKYLIVIAFLFGCTVNLGASDPTPVNSCAAPNANYSESFTESSGTCGPRNASSLATDSDGNVLIATDVSCTVSQTNGCDSIHQCSVIAQNGCQVNFDSHLTFSKAGSVSGNETVSVQCPDGSYCSSQYQVTGSRR